MARRRPPRKYAASLRRLPAETRAFAGSAFVGKTDGEAPGDASRKKRTHPRHQSLVDHRGGMVILAKQTAPSQHREASISSRGEVLSEKGPRNDYHRSAGRRKDAAAWPSSVSIPNCRLYCAPHLAMNRVGIDDDAHPISQD